jgi:hypothetical protein
MDIPQFYAKKNGLVLLYKFMRWKYHGAMLGQETSVTFFFLHSQSNREDNFMNLPTIKQTFGKKCFVFDYERPRCGNTRRNRAPGLETTVDGKRKGNIQWDSTGKPLQEINKTQKQNTRIGRRNWTEWESSVNVALLDCNAVWTWR